MTEVRVDGVYSDLSTLEEIEVRLEVAKEELVNIFNLANSEFHSKDKDETTAELKLLTDIGAHAASAKVHCDSINTIVNVLNDIKE